MQTRLKKGFREVLLQAYGQQFRVEGEEAPSPLIVPDGLAETTEPRDNLPREIDSSCPAANNKGKETG